ncbi:hypothetical protein [Labilithrix luteola]|nr:hypothetical protein [Labilithrix luteola]
MTNRVCRIVGSLGLVTSFALVACSGGDSATDDEQSTSALNTVHMRCDKPVDGKTEFDAPSSGHDLTSADIARMCPNDAPFEANRSCSPNVTTALKAVAARFKGGSVTLSQDVLLDRRYDAAGMYRGHVGFGVGDLTPHSIYYGLGAMTCGVAAVRGGQTSILKGSYRIESLRSECDFDTGRLTNLEFRLPDQGAASQVVLYCSSVSSAEPGGLVLTDNGGKRFGASTPNEEASSPQSTCAGKGYSCSFQDCCAPYECTLAAQSDRPPTCR